MLIFFSIVANSQNYIIAKKPKKEEETKKVLKIYNRYKDADTLFIKDKYLQNSFRHNLDSTDYKVNYYRIAGIFYGYSTEPLPFNKLKCLNVNKLKFYKKNKSKILNNKTLKKIEKSKFLKSNLLYQNKTVILIYNDNLFDKQLKLFTLNLKLNL